MKRIVKIVIISLSCVVLALVIYVFYKIYINFNYSSTQSSIDDEHMRSDEACSRANGGYPCF